MSENNTVLKILGHVRISFFNARIRSMGKVMFSVCLLTGGGGAGPMPGPVLRFSEGGRGRGGGALLVPGLGEGGGET